MELVHLTRYHSHWQIYNLTYKSPIPNQVKFFDTLSISFKIFPVIK